ncbi:MAG TPA: ABC transporter transmembrane domain-containing protein [Stellaceae bacterium]|nr:ABC transporter transmembrane domain-containing protein [Stellaceae bacterium]
MAKRLFREFVRPHIGRLLGSVFFMFVVAATTTTNAWMMQPVLDRIFIQRSSMGWLWLIAGAVIGLALIKGVASYFQQVLMTTVGQRIIADIQDALFAKLVRADIAFFHRTHSGELVSRFINDTNLMRFATTQAITGFGRDALSVVGLIGMMFYQDWSLALVSLVGLPAIIGPVRRLSRRMRKVSIGVQEEMAHLTTSLSQVFQGPRHVKAYGMEAYETRRIGALTEKIYRLVEKASRTRSATSPLMETVGSVAVASVILFGGWEVIHGTRTPGAFFSFVTALLMAYAPLKNLTNLNVNVQDGLAATERVFAVLDMEPTIVDRPDAVPLALSGGAIRFEGVRFAYADSANAEGARVSLQAALNGLSIDVPAGAKVALVGPSGAGKSTILNLIPRFYDVASGRVAIDGQDVRAVTLDSLRGAMALVSQEVSLFDDTIRANIAYGSLGASDDDIVRAAQDAAAHEFIMNLPAGYDTLVGEQGIRLSGGQRQRIAIARAMLKNAPILLLDEATSALDTESERAIQGALRRLMAGRTSLVIAHRLSTIQDADLIYAIDGGMVAECGTHDELLAKNGVYARLWQMQFAGADMGLIADAGPGVAVEG